MSSSEEPAPMPDVLGMMERMRTDAANAEAVYQAVITALAGFDNESTLGVVTGMTRAYAFLLAQYTTASGQEVWLRELERMVNHLRAAIDAESTDG